MFYLALKSRQRGMRFPDYYLSMPDTPKKKPFWKKHLDDAKLNQPSPLSLPPSSDHYMAMLNQLPDPRFNDLMLRSLQNQMSSMSVSTGQAVDTDRTIFRDVAFANSSDKRPHFIIHLSSKCDSIRGLNDAVRLTDKWFTHLFTPRVPNEKRIRECLKIIYGEDVRYHLAKDGADFRRAQEFTDKSEYLGHPRFISWRHQAENEKVQNPIIDALQMVIIPRRFPRGVYEQSNLVWLEDGRATQELYMEVMTRSRRALEDTSRVLVEPIINALRWELHPEEWEQRAGRFEPGGSGGAGGGMRLSIDAGSNWATTNNQQWIRTANSNLTFADNNGTEKAFTIPLHVTHFTDVAFLEIAAKMHDTPLGEKQQALIDLYSEGIMSVAADNEVILLLPVPKNLTMTNGRLHNDTDCAVEWPNGRGLHFLYGVWFDGRVFGLINDPKAPYEGILKLGDVDQRMAAMRHRGPENLLPGVGADLVSRSARGNELHKIPHQKRIFRTDAYFLKYTDPSTGKIYVSGVPAKGGAKETNPYWNGRDVALSQDADACMAWKFHMTPQEYKDLKIEG